MTVFHTLPILFTCVGLAFSLPQAQEPPIPTITTAPVLLQRTLDSSVIGWSSFSGQWISQYCDAGYVTTSGAYAQCCDNYDTCTIFPTGCAFSSVIVAAGTSGTCDFSTYTNCISIFVYDNFNDPIPETFIGCNRLGMDRTVYRTLPATAITLGGFTNTGGIDSLSFSLPTRSSQSSTSTTRKTSSISDSTSADIVTVTYSGTSTSAPTPTQSPSSSGSSSSKAWVAGAVIGPFAAVAIGGLAFWIYRLKRKQPPPTAPPAPPPMSPAPQPMVYQQPYQQPVMGPPPPGSPPVGGYNRYPGQGGASPPAPYPQPAVYPQPQPPMQSASPAQELILMQMPAPAVPQS